jgi:hypothetical protein
MRPPPCWSSSRPIGLKHQAALPRGHVPARAAPGGVPYLPRNEHAKVARTSDEGLGLKVDFDAGDVPIGIEITSPEAVTADDVNELLARLGQPELPSEDWAPLRAA